MQNLDTLSQSSFHSSVSRFNIPRKVMVDGDIIDSEFFMKEITFNSNIVIETPETIKNKIHGDKTVNIRFIQIYDATITSNRDAVLFQIQATAQRNNFNSTGKQSSIIGCGSYVQNVSRWQLDSQTYEQDSFYPIKLQILINRRDGQGYVPYTLPNDNISFIQYDIQTIYNFI